MNTTVGKSALLALILIANFGCMRVGEVPPMMGVPPSGGFRLGDIVDTRSGKVIPMDSFVGELSKAQIVYVGETHTSTEDHRIQEEILKRLQGRGGAMALGMEMFPRESQPVLDRFSGKLIDEDVFLKEVNWENVWGYPFRLYRPILMFAREKGIPILGLNAPRDVVSKIATAGLHSLGPGDRERVARDFHREDAKHREYVRSQYVDHVKESIKSFDSFFEAQLAWEETMAQTLAHRLLQSSGKEQIVVLIGKGHISHQVGLPKLTRERTPHFSITVAPMPMDYPMAIADPDVADYVWVTDKSEPVPRGKLGIMIRPLASREGLEILSVVPGSPAEKAGVRKGDVLIKIDGKSLSQLEDLHKAMMGRGNLHELTLKRNGRVLSLTVTISP